MKLYEVVIFFTFFYTSSLLLQAYISYPVAVIDKTQEVIIVRQNSLDDFEVQLINPEDDTHENLLFSLYLPAHIQLLPLQDGFSFIDEGIVYVKKFTKRHPKAIFLSYPLRSIQHMQWIHNYTFIYCAQENDNSYNFFTSTTNGETNRLTYDSSVDFLYPYAKDGIIYAIAKDRVSKEYMICMLSWQEQDVISKKNIHYEKILQLNTPLCHIHMVSNSEGFFLSYPPLSSSNHFFEFTCHHIVLTDNNKWSEKPLFNFSIPAKYIIGTGPERVYESLERFLPYYDSTKACIYFISSNNLECLELFSYHLINQSIEKKENMTPKSTFDCVGICKRNESILTGSMKKNIRLIYGEFNKDDVQVFKL